MNRAKQYAKALVSLKGNPHEAAITEKVIAELKESGRTKLLPRILRELHILQKRGSVGEASVEVAHQKDSETALAVASAEGITATRTHVNHALLSGWRARSKGALIDHSGKSALITIYKKVTS